MMRYFQISFKAAVLQMLKKNEKITVNTVRYVQWRNLLLLTP